MPDLPLDAVTTEYWFHRQLDCYSLLAPPYTVEEVKPVLQLHLPERFNRLAPRVFEPENAQMWLSFILRADEIIQLWRSPDEALLVAVSSLASGRQIQSNIDLISSEQFSVARSKLGIAKHWFVALPGYPLVAPTRTQLMQAFEKQLELEPECGVIRLDNQFHQLPSDSETFYIENLLKNPLPWEKEALVAKNQLG